MTKLEQSLLVIVLVLLVFVGGLGIIFFKDQYTKKELKEDLNKTIMDLENLNKSINDGKINLDKNYYSNINNIDNFISTNTDLFDKVNDFSSLDNSNYLINVGINSYLINDEADKDLLIASLVRINNELNETLQREREERNRLLNDLSTKTTNIITNTVLVKEKVDKLEVTKTISWAVGLDGSWDGIVENVRLGNHEVAYSIHAHGLMFIKNKFYVGLQLGVAKQITFNPSVGVLVGYKIN